MKAHQLRTRGRWLAAGAIALAVGSGLCVGATAPSHADQNVVVAPAPDTKQPRVMDGRVYSITSDGPDVIVGGTFTKVRVGSSSQPVWVQPKLFRFNSDTGEIDTTFTPVINGNVEAVTYTADKQSLIIAGAFTTINGQPAQRIAKLNLDGSLDTSFNASAGSTVKDFALLGDRLILGGEFGKINTKSVRGLAAIDPDTGAIDLTFDLPISESRDQYAPYVQELDVSADGKWLVIGGNFKRVGNATRHQVAVIDLTGTSPTVAPWATDRYEMQCSGSYPDTYIRGVDISPDGKYFVVNTTGAYFAYDTMCDSTARWELPPAGDRWRPAADVGQPHRRRHLLGGGDHRVRRLRRRPHAVVEQPASFSGRRQRRARIGRSRRHRGTGPLLRRPAVVESRPRPRPRCRVPLRHRRLLDGRPRHVPLRGSAAAAPRVAARPGRHHQPGPAGRPPAREVLLHDLRRQPEPDGVRRRQLRLDHDHQRAEQGRRQLDRKQRRLRPGRQAELLRSVAGVLLAVLRRHRSRVPR